MSPVTADEAVLYFTVALTVLLAGSVLAVIRQPPWTPGPAPQEHSPHPGSAGWANDGAAAPGRPGRHAAGPPAEAPVPLPVRSPGQSGWTAPAAGGGTTQPESWRSPVSGGPPWGPAPRPPGAR
jgi:hypothetical protein